MAQALDRRNCGSRFRALLGHTGTTTVAQTSKSAVSRVSKPAVVPTIVWLTNSAQPADLEVGDWLARSHSFGPAGLAFAALRQSLSPLPQRLKSAGFETCATSALPSDDGGGVQMRPVLLLPRDRLRAFGFTHSVTVASRYCPAGSMAGFVEALVTVTVPVNCTPRSNRTGPATLSTSHARSDGTPSARAASI